MLKCSECNRSLEEKKALVHTAKTGEKRILCPECFERLSGIDYKTFAYRKENARQTFFAVLLCLGATAYAFWDKGLLWGSGGLVLTVLVYLFSSKAR